MPQLAPQSPDDSFITRPLSICLDLVRFGAALVVLVCHAAQAKLYAGQFPNIPLAQHYAVVVFFVLSGLVITTSVQRRPATLTRFAIARAARILPVSITALAFATLAFAVTAALGGPAQHTDTYGELSLRGTILPLLFLSESPWGAGPVWNPPYWSLCYEVWYYALFGAAVFLRGPTRIIALAVCALLAGPRILLMLPVWLVGVVLALSPPARRAGPVSGAILLVAGIAGAWLHTTFVSQGLELMQALAGPYQNQLSFSRFALSDFLLALAVATAFTGLRPLVTRWPAPWRAIARPAQLLAGFSFTLYLFHWPLLLLAKSAGLTVGTSRPGFAAAIIVMVGVCYAISLVTEQQRDRVRGWLESAAARLRRSGPVLTA
ncbi:MAG: acyltransferase [Alphaproteobacteria bacterium]|nr:acyltransferase [Alphaproteobacteria bacterium]